VCGASRSVGWLDGQAGGLFKSQSAFLRSPGARSREPLRRRSVF
jgi:hypothetical protein